MKHSSLPISLALLPSLGLLGADLTAENLKRQLEECQPIELKIPSDLEPYERLENNRFRCVKCNKQLLLTAEPKLLAALTARLNAKCAGRYKFHLDNSRICPHCGDGNYHLEIQQKSLDLKTEKECWKPWRDIPATQEDLLLLLRLWGDDKAVVERLPVLGAFEMFPRDSFFKIRDEEQMREMTDDYYALIAKTVKKKQRELADANAKKNLAKLKKLSEIYQKLTESAAHILRREDLNDLLEKIAKMKQENSNYLSDSVSNIFAMSRIGIPMEYPVNWMPFSCPKCKGRFYVLNRQDFTLFHPLGDLLTVLEKVDVTPDYSSLCPYCHPNQKEPKLTVTLRAAGQQDVVAELSQKDLKNLAILFKSYPEVKQIFLPSEIMRLKEILLGEKKFVKASAIPLPAEHD